MADCGKCGHEHHSKLGGRPCTGHRSRNHATDPGGPCAGTAMTGQDVCPAHGGRSPQAKAAAARRVQEEKVAAVARKLIPDLADRTRITNPLETLLELASEAHAFRESLRLLANEVEEIRTTGAGGSEHLRAEVATYRQALKDVTDVLVAIARLDLDTLLARIESRKVDLLITALTDGLGEAGLDSDQKRAVMTSVGRRLRSVPLAAG